MDDAIRRLQLAIAATRFGGGQRTIAAKVRASGLSAFERLIEALDPTDLLLVEEQAHSLVSDGVEAVLLGWEGYPELLALSRQAPAALFVKGPTWPPRSVQSGCVVHARRVPKGCVPPMPAPMQSHGAGIASSRATQRVLIWSRTQQPSRAAARLLSSSRKALTTSVSGAVSLPIYGIRNAPLSSRSSLQIKSGLPPALWPATPLFLT